MKERKDYGEQIEMNEVKMNCQVKNCNSKATHKHKEKNYCKRCWDEITSIENMNKEEKQMKKKNIFGIVALFLVVMIPFASAQICTDVSDSEAEPLFEKIVDNNEVNTYIVTKGKDRAIVDMSSTAQLFSPTTTQLVEKLRFCDLKEVIVGMDKVYIEKGYRDEALRNEEFKELVKEKQIEFSTVYNDAPANSGGSYSFLNQLSYVDVTLNGWHSVAIDGNINLNFTGEVANPLVEGVVDMSLEGTVTKDGEECNWICSWRWHGFCMDWDLVCTATETPVEIPETLTGSGFEISEEGDFNVDLNAEGEVDVTITGDFTDMCIQGTVDGDFTAEPLI